VGYGLRVVVDASYNALSEAAVATKREDVLQVELMSRELTEELAGLEELHAALQKAGIADVMWAAVGGNPADYFRLRRVWRRHGDVTVAAAIFVADLVGKAAEARSIAVAADERLSPLFERFARTAAVPVSALEAMKLVRSSPDKVLRKVMPAGEALLVPATPATALVLRHGLRAAPSLDDLKRMVQQQQTKQPTSPFQEPSSSSSQREQTPIM
jgi:hypothetical protein